MENLEKKLEKNLEYYAWQKIRKGQLYIIIVYNILFLLLAIYYILSESKLMVYTEYTLLLRSISFAVMSSSMYYLRKIYKHLIRDEIKLVEAGEATTHVYGTLLYYLIRPILTISVSIIVFYMVEIFIRMTVSNSPEYSIGYVYLLSLVEFYSGFSAGRFIENTEIVSKKIVDSLFRKMGE